MARVGIVFGLLLCGITFGGLVTTTDKNPTQFFPMMLGIPVLFCGVVALNPHRRKHAMQVAATVTAIGALLGLIRAAFVLVQMVRGIEVNGPMLVLVVAMSFTSFAFTAICVMSLMLTQRKAETMDTHPGGHSINIREQSASDGTVADTRSRESA